jgi:F-type H+-transporting ATPase subunit b
MKRLSSKMAAPLLAVGLALGMGAVATHASAQQPPPGRDPHTLPLGEGPPRGFPPGGQPGQPGQMGQPPRGFPPGGQPGQMGQPPRGFPPGGQPPRGFPPRRVQQPEPEEHAAAHHECPGHGPLDSPHGINWWQGIIGVNNEAAKFETNAEGHPHRVDSFLSQLLWRYENDRDECDPKNQPPPFLASLLNFGLLAFLLYRFGRKPLAEALAARKKAMMQEIDTATRLREEAEERLADYEEKLDNLDETLEQLKKDYAAQGEAERKHVLAEAEERRARMKRDVEFRLAQEAKAAREILLQEAVDKAVVAAEEMLAKKVSAADQDRAAEEYLAGLAGAWKAEAVASRGAGGAA